MLCESENWFKRFLHQLYEARSLRASRKGAEYPLGDDTLFLYQRCYVRLLRLLLACRLKVVYIDPVLRSVAVASSSRYQDPRLDVFISPIVSAAIGYNLLN